MNVTRKQKLWIIITSAVLLALAVIAIGVYFGLFYIKQFYDVDIDAIRKTNPIFNEEFNGNSLNTEIWSKNYDVLFEKFKEDEEPTVRRGGYWEGAQAKVNDGKLNIHMEERDGKYYTTGVATKEQFKYGYYEIKATLPKAYGMWSAFWMLPRYFDDDYTGIAKNAGAEIDIMEAPCYPRGKVQQAIHNGGWFAGPNRKTESPAYWVFHDHGDLYDSPHTYGLYWDPYIYKFYVDGKCMWTTNFKGDVSAVAAHVILSVEFGGEDGIPNDPVWQFVGGKSVQQLNEKELALFDSKPAFSIDYLKIWNVDDFHDTKWIEKNVK